MERLREENKQAAELVDKARASLQVAISERADALMAVEESKEVIWPLLAKIKSLQARLAAAHAFLKYYANECDGPEHEADCPCDDTCECPIVKLFNAAYDAQEKK